MEAEYAAQPVHDGARNAEAPAYTPGSCVIIRRGRRGQFGVKARGPFRVVEDLGPTVRLVDVSNNRTILEAKSNVKLLSLRNV